MPAMGLVAACATMGVDVRDVRFTRESVIIPRPQGDLVIPTLTQPDGQYVGAGAFLEVPLFGKRTQEARQLGSGCTTIPNTGSPRRVPVLDVFAASDRCADQAKRGDRRVWLGRILEVTADPARSTN